MLRLNGFNAPVQVHPLTAAGPIPSVCDPDGFYPYPSFVETGRRPVLRNLEFVTIENDELRVTICPDLGGKVCQILHQRSGRAVLFDATSVCPARILPRFGFVPGGIEVSFPIAHTPVQLERMAWRSATVGNRVYVWCGESELRYGLQWTVEYSLGEGEAFLAQRVLLHNPTAQSHPWMSWSNAAVPARPDTEFHFPNGPVLRHASGVETIDWATQGPRRVGDVQEMTGFFWLRPDAMAFGAYTPSLGHGLYHLADPRLAPGIKLWTYGVGAHEAWARVGSLSGESYVEIQAGPIRDQSIKEHLLPRQRRFHLEFWLPSAAPLELRALELPQPRLCPLEDLPLFGWPPREEARFWLSVITAWEKQLIQQLPGPPAIDLNWWAPSGMEQLGEALRWAVSAGPVQQRGAWLFQLGAWRAARNQVEGALAALAASDDDRARALAARIRWRAQGDARAAVQCLRSIGHPAIALHPQVMVERDLALAALGPETLAERESWLARLANCADEWLLERRAAWLIDAGRFQEARSLLEQASFQLVHQRYERTRLWRRACRALGLPEAAAPASLGEDNLADFGAYREFQQASG